MRSVFATGGEYTELHRQAHDDAPPANDLPKASQESQLILGRLPRRCRG